MKTQLAFLSTLVLGFLPIHGQVRVSDFGSAASLYGGGSWGGSFTTDSDAGVSFLKFGSSAGLDGQVDGRFGTVPDAGSVKRVVFRYRIDAQNNASNVNFVLTDCNLQSCSASVKLNTQRTGWQYAYALIDVSGLDLSGGLKSWAIAGASSIPVSGSSLRISIDYVDVTSFTGPEIPALFDPESYLARNPDVAVAVAGRRYAAWDHYWDAGVYEGRTDGLFDVRDYLASYGDLRAAFGTDLHATILHWYGTGRGEGRMVPFGFDAGGYLVRNPDLAAVVGRDAADAWEHYARAGVVEGRVFSDDFAAGDYLAMYGDLQAAFGSDLVKATRHWLGTGRWEGRMGRVPPTFDFVGYLAWNPDVYAAVGADRARAWVHYIDRGIDEGRWEGDFVPVEYLAQYGDIYAAFGADLEAAALHWFLQGRYEGRRIPSGFDIGGYLVRNVDVAAAFTYGPGGAIDRYGAWLHYYSTGINEGRVYDDAFRVDEYLAMYSDLRAAFGSDRRAALRHWLSTGRTEGRTGRF